MIDVVFYGISLLHTQHTNTVTAAAGISMEDLINFSLDNDVQLIAGSVYNPTLGGTFSSGTAVRLIKSNST